KDLQQRWRSVGPVPRDIDHRLWEEFRLHSDALFQKRQQEFAHYTAGLDSNRTRAIELCEALERIAGLAGPELLQSAAALAELSAAFESLGEFPRADARALHNRFERAIGSCEEALAQQRVRDAERGWEDLFEAADRVRAYKLAVARDADIVQRDALRHSVETYIASVERWPKGGLEAIKHALG